MANRDIELALRLTADSRLLGVGLKQGERGVTDFSRKGQQELRKLGKVSDEVRGHFSNMAGSFAKAAGGLYIAHKIKPGVAVAGDLQEAMLGVKTELMGSVDGALAMDKALHAMKSTAFDIQKSTPFDQAQIVNLEKELLKGGAKIEQIVGKQGAAAAAAALAAYEGIDAVMAGESLISIATPFNLAGDQFMMLANQAGAAGSASTASFASIAEGAKYAAGSMAGLGRDSKEMFALLATLDQGGLKGSMGGTSLSAFFRQAVKVDAFKDANGDLKSTVEILDTLRKRLDGMGTAKRAGFLQKIFGDEGGRAAQILLRQGAGSYEDMIAQMGKAVSLQDKLAERLKGYNAQLESLRGTAKSTFATMFEPALDPLTKLISKTNEWAGALGEAALENKNIGQIGTGVAAGVAGAGLLYGGYHLLKGLGSGGKMLGALKGGAGLAGGVAMGKALEEAAGVPSVFVVNMPKEFGGMLGTPDKVAGKVAKGGGVLATASRFGVPALALTGAGAAGYGVGSIANMGIDKGLSLLAGRQTSMGGLLYDAVNGNKAEQTEGVGTLAKGAGWLASPMTMASVALSKHLIEALRSEKTEIAKPAEMKGEITIRIEGDQRAKVTKLESRGGPDMSVYTGSTGAGR